MRLFFGDGDRLRAKARDNLDQGLARIRRWWSKKYNLPPNHSLLESQSLGEVFLEMYEDAMLEKDELELELKHADSNRGGISARLRSLSTFLEEKGAQDEKTTPDGDDLFDKWEAELAAGMMPDLNERP